MGRATPPFQVKCFWSLAQIPVKKMVVVHSNGRGGVRSVGGVGSVGRN
ncbi:MAG: hypothetical protein AB4080_22000 [Trichodesmium sp.]